MSWETKELGGEGDQGADGGIGGIDAGFTNLFVAQRAAMPPIEAFGELIDDVEAEAEGFADVADGAAAAVGDDGGGHSGAFAAVLFVDVLDDLLAAFVLEVD